MNWQIFTAAVAIALLAKFISTRKMSPGQRQAWVIVAVAQGAVLGMLTPPGFSGMTLIIVATLYAGDLIGYQLGSAIDKARIWWRMREYGQTIEAARIQNEGMGTGSERQNSGDEGESVPIHEQAPD